MNEIPKQVSAGDEVVIKGKTYIFEARSASIFNAFIDFREKVGQWPGLGGLDRKISIRELSNGKKARHPVLLKFGNVARAVLTAQQKQ